MKSFKQKFYEEVYPLKKTRLKLRSSFSFLYTLLKKYEDYRANVVYRLLPGGKFLVDIGCGDGQFVFRAMSKYKNCVGTDIAGTRLTKAKKKVSQLSKKNRKRISFISSDADSKLPFRTNSVTTITMIASLEHFFDPYQIFTEIKRILEKGGTVIFQVPNLSFFPRRIAVALGFLPVTSEDESGWDGGHLHYFTVGSLEQFLLHFGFKVNVVTCSGVFAFLRRWYVSLLGADIIIKAEKT